MDRIGDCCIDISTGKNNSDDFTLAKVKTLLL